MRNLRGTGEATGDEAVHEARKSIKKTRALLRLVRTELGGAYKTENARLRDAGRMLSELRDASALIGALEDLRKNAHGVLSRRAVEPIRRALLAQKRQVQKETGNREYLRRVAAVLARARRSAKEWRLGADGFGAIEAGLEETFRDGRRALRRVLKTQTREDLHEWRKRVKDHWYQVGLLEDVWCDVMQGYESSLKKTEDTLGESLNLMILRQRVSADAGEIRQAIDRSQKELRGRALEVGKKVYAEKPSELTHQLARLWKRWHR